MTTITDRLLNRSEKTPAKMDTSISGKVKDDKGEGRLGLGRGFEFRAHSHVRGQLLDGQQRDHQLPRVVIERPEELGNKKSTKRRTVWVTFAVAH